MCNAPAVYKQSPSTSSVDEHVLTAACLLANLKHISVNAPRENSLDSQVALSPSNCKYIEP